MSIIVFTPIQTLLQQSFANSGLTQLQLDVIAQVLSDTEANADGTASPGGQFDNLMQNNSAALPEGESAIFYSGESTFGQSGESVTLLNQTLAQAFEAANSGKYGMLGDTEIGQALAKDGMTIASSAIDAANNMQNGVRVDLITAER